VALWLLVALVAVITKNCRDDSGRSFLPNRCLEYGNDLVIRIHTVYVGFDSDLDTERCPYRSGACQRTINHYDAIARCNGQCSCCVRQTVFNYPQNNVTRLCDEHKDANYIYFRYDCVPGTWKFVIWLSSQASRILYMTDFFYANVPGGPKGNIYKRIRQYSVIE